VKALPRIRVRYAGAFAVVFGLSLAESARAQGPIQAGVGVGYRYYDHMSPQNVGAATYQAKTVTPRLRVREATPVSFLDLWAERRFEFYTQDAALDTLIGTGNHTADRASLEARHEFSELDEVKAHADYVRSRDLLDIEQGTVTAAGDQRRWDVGTQGALWHVEGGFGLEDRRYKEAGTADAQNLEWTARAVPLKLPANALFAGFYQLHIDLDQKNGLGLWTVLDKRMPHVGFRHAITPSLKGEITGGVANVYFGDGTSQRRTALGAVLERRSDAPTSFRFEVGFEGDSLSLARANMQRNLGNGAVWLSGESYAEAEGGFASYPALTRRFAAGVRDTLGRANVLYFETSYEHARPIHFAGQRTESYRAAGWLQRRMQPWLDARIGASFLRQQVHQQDGEPLYRRFRMDAELSAMLP